MSKSDQFVQIIKTLIHVTYFNIKFYTIMSNNAMSITKSPVQFDKAVESRSSKKDLVLVKQTTTSTYASARGGNDLSGSLFSQSAFGEGETYTSDRYALISLPVGTTEEEVVSQLATLPNACIYRILSNDVNDVLSSDQKEMVRKGLSSKSMEDYKEDKAVKTNVNGVLTLMKDDNDRVQYRGTFFHPTAKADIDLRKAIGVVEEVERTSSVNIDQDDQEATVEISADLPEQAEM